MGFNTLWVERWLCQWFTALDVGDAVLMVLSRLQQTRSLRFLAAMLRCRLLCNVFSCIVLLEWSRSNKKASIAASQLVGESVRACLYACVLLLLRLGKDEESTDKGRGEVVGTFMCGSCRYQAQVSCSLFVLCAFCRHPPWPTLPHPGSPVPSRSELCCVARVWPTLRRRSVASQIALRCVCWVCTKCSVLHRSLLSGGFFLYSICLCIECYLSIITGFIEYSVTCLERPPFINGHVSCPCIVAGSISSFMFLGFCLCKEDLSETFVC